MLIKLLAKLLRATLTLKNRWPKLAKAAWRPLGKIGRFFLFMAVLPTYKSYLVIKKIINKFYAPQKSRHKIIHPFSRRYLIHLIIIVMALSTVTANLNANEIRQDVLGQKSIVASLISETDLGEIEIEGPISANKKVTRYLGQVGVESKPPATEGSQGEELLPTTVAGGSAVVQPILSPAEEDSRQRDQIVYYTVQPGDTISEIAEKFSVTTNTILWENNLSAYSLVRPGDTLVILPTSGIKHKVAKGENLAKIATTYGITAEQIIEFNKLASADDLKIGESLVIPGGKKITPAPTYALRTFTQPAVVPSPKIVSSGDMTWPATCRRITQYFRYRHSGVDIACKQGEAIYAADDGKVIKAQGGYNGGYGIMVIVDHGGGKHSLYGHLSSLYVKVGEDITKGQAVGAMGSTGRSTGPHVHFEIRLNGTRVNPLSYIN